MSNNITNSRFIKSTCVLLLFLQALSCQQPKNQHASKPSEQDGKASLVAQTQKIDLGRLSKSEKDTIRFQFVLTNESDSSTVIHNIDVSCGCISLTYKAKPIPPKTSATLHGFVNIKNQEGHLSKAIFVNYGKGELLVLRVTADVE